MFGRFLARHHGSASGSPTWRERVSALRYLLPVLKLVWESHHGYAASVLVLRLIRSSVPIAALWVAKLIIDAVVAIRGGSGDSRRLWQLVGVELAIVVTGDLLGRALAVIEVLLADLFSNHTSVRLMAHAATLDLHHFEDPAFYDQLERARLQSTNRLGVLAQLLSLGQDLVTMISLCAALFVYDPWLILLVLVTVFPGFIAETRFATLEYSLFWLRTPARRRLDYLRYVGASNATAKEVQLFGLSPWLISRFRGLSERFFTENKRLSVKRGLVSGLLSLIATLGYYGAYAMIVMRAVDGSITIGTLTFLAGSFMRTRDLIQRQLTAASSVYQHSLYLKDLFDFFDMKPSIISSPGAPAVAQPIREGIVFQNVSFRYPGSGDWAVRNVSFSLGPGERIALVGENGAGKTTVTKLLARLYDPTDGRILLDGRDLREYDLQSVRCGIGVIFQDYVRYDWRFDENIGVGEIEQVKSYLTIQDELPSAQDELPSANGKKRANGGEPGTVAPGPATVPFSIISAAEKSLASTLLPRFSHGYRQMLGQRFDNGIELSGGEWQKIALARAYMRDAQVLILDEPTASLDARAEYEVFKRFSNLISGRMAVIISHRFSTVRMADRIIVLQKGEVVEQGSHDVLVASAGPYAELFALQAEGYR